ncbi:hypothetical protein IH779_00315 [Patescibacteria group bacterium]|nr:hypothetical protein [Patescibacteria group bacterium]
MMKYFKKILCILVFVSFWFLVFGGLVLAQELEQIYPQVPRAETPTTVKTLLPEYIQFLFNFALIIAGFVAFISLVYGGLRYLASAGNPTVMSDARSQITAGILGLLILITAYLFLIQLNPQLVTLTIEKKEFAKGVILYTNLGCPGNANPEAAGLVVDKDFLRVRGSMSSLGDPAVGGFNNKTKSIYFYSSNNELQVKIFGEGFYGPEPAGENPVWDSEKDAAPYPFSSGDCFAVPSASKSIQLIWKLPGVYLFTDTECKENPKLFVTDIADLGDFTDKAKSMKIVSKTRITCGFGSTDPIFDACNNHPDGLIQCADLATYTNCQKTVPVDKFGAILYEDNNFRHDAEVFFGGSTETWSPQCITLNDGGEPCGNNMFSSFCQNTVGTSVSSIAVFKQWMGNEISPGGVALYEHENLNLDENGLACGMYVSQVIEKPRWITDCSVFPPNQVSSIKIEGNYIAVLFRDDGRGQVFRKTVLRLKDQHIGDNQTKFMLVIPISP